MTVPSRDDLLKAIAAATTDQHLATVEEVARALGCSSSALGSLLAALIGEGLVQLVQAGFVDPGQYDSAVRLTEEGYQYVGNNRQPWRSGLRRSFADALPRRALKRARRVGRERRGAPITPRRSRLLCLGRCSSR